MIGKYWRSGIPRDLSLALALAVRLHNPLINVLPDTRNRISRSFSSTTSFVYEEGGWIPLIPAPLVYCLTGRLEGGRWPEPSSRDKIGDANFDLTHQSSFSQETNLQHGIARHILGILQCGLRGLLCTRRQRQIDPRNEWTSKELHQEEWSDRYHKNCLVSARTGQDKSRLDRLSGTVHPGAVS